MDHESQHRGRGMNKHYWTTQEDKVLIEALVELSTNTMWRGENGFKNGYLYQLEKMMKEKFPQTTLKAVPNIESRVKLFRSKNNAIADILGISGFTWDNNNSTIEFEKSAYVLFLTRSPFNSYHSNYCFFLPCIKTHKEVAGLYGKSFPFFNDLALVFAKDRAQGNARGDLGDDAEQYMHDTFAHMDDNANFVPLSSDDSFIPMDDHIDSPPPNSYDNCNSSSIGRKRKNCVKEQNITAISAKFHHFVDLVGPGFKTLAECVVRDSEAKAYMVAARKEVDEQKKLLNDVIFNIHGLTEDEALMVMQILRKDEEQLNMFWEFPEERKLRFCRLLLGECQITHPCDAI